MKRIVLTSFAAAGLLITGLNAQEIKARQEPAGPDRPGGKIRPAYGW
jgi:hypothetical protein